VGEFRGTASIMLLEKVFEQLILKKYVINKATEETLAVGPTHEESLGR
jgi:hypothetical protein